MSRITEVTFTVKRDTNTRKIYEYKVWTRTGLVGEDPPRRTLYEGPHYGEALAAMNGAAETS